MSDRMRVLAALVVVGACDASRPPTHEVEASGTEPTALRPGREMRLASPGDRARFGFRPEGGGYRAGHTTHEVRVAAGVLRVTPSHLGVAGAAIEIETTAAARGDQMIDLSIASSRIDDESGALEVRRAGLSERFENFEGGIEQSWQLESAPAGTGDLVVEVAVLGHDYVATTERGLHVASAGGLGFRYSHATWIGADGNEHTIPAHYQDGAIRLVVGAEILATTVFPAVLDPVIEPEIAVDKPVSGGAGDVSDQAAVAWSGSQYLAVWRQAIPGVYGTAVRAARIAADGTVLDPAGLYVFAKDFNAEQPSATFFDGAFVVAYHYRGVVRLSRVRSDGVVRQVGRISEESGSCQGPDIASGAGEAMTVYTRCGTSSTIQAVRYDGDTASPPVSLGSGDASAATPRIAVSPAGVYLAVWSDPNDDIRGRFISPAGVPGTEVVISAAARTEASPDVAFAGSGFVVAWQERTASSQTIRAVQVSPSGAVGTAVDVSSATDAAGEPSITCGADCLVTWSGGPEDAIDLRARRLTADLAAVTDEWVLVGGARIQGPGAIASAGSEHYLVWPDEESGLLEVRGATASDDPTGRLALGADVLLARRASNSESDPTVGVATSSWLVAWTDDRNGGSDIYGKRFGLDGIEETRRAHPIHEGPDLQENVQLASNGDQYLAAWNITSRPHGVRVARVEGDGTVLDPGGIKIGNGTSAHVGGAAGGASGWLVAWSRQLLAGEPHDLTYPLYITTVGLNGATSTPVTVASDSWRQGPVAYDPEADLYVVLWLEAGTGNLVAIRVRPDGTVLDSTPVLIADPTGTFFYGAQIAYGGRSFLVAWRSGGGFDGDIEGARFRLGPSGIELLTPGGVPLVTSPENESAIALTFTARGFLLAFERSIAAPEGAHSDIYGLQISTGGLVGNPFLIAGGPGNERAPAISGATGGRALLAYQRTSGSDPTRIYVRRLIAASPDGAICTGGAQCESGFCTDGRCCDSACGDGNPDDCQACSTAQGAEMNGICGPVESPTCP